MKTSVVSVSETRLFLYEWGERNARLAIYWDGLGGTGLHANEIGPILAREHGIRVIAPDAPGHGRSPVLAPEAYRPSTLASLTAELLSALGIAEAAFVGFSWGAEVACAFAARYPTRTNALVLVDGGYWDFADLPDFDTSADLSVRIARARERAGKDWYPTWDAYFAAERAALRRWTPAVEDAHRATMREHDGRILPIVSPDVLGGINYGNCVEPTASTHDALREAGMPILLVTPRIHGRNAGIASAGIRRFQEQVPLLEVRELPTDVHDLVSHAGPEIAAIVGNWLGRHDRDDV
jgi:pimeloyl-ACP methyl ester carboxylesterase